MTDTFTEVFTASMNDLLYAINFSNYENFKTALKRIFII